MADIGSVFSGLGSGLSAGFATTMWVVVGLVFFSAVAGLIGWWIYRRNYWNMRVEFKIPRSDGLIINGEWGKGHYNAKKGLAYLKRPRKMGKIKMKGFDAKKYLQGNNLLTVVQVTPHNYVPVLPKTYTHFVSDTTGEEMALLDLYADLSEDKNWRVQAERSAKGAYSIQSLLQQYQVPLAIGIVALMIFVGFAIIWGRLPSICK